MTLDEAIYEATLLYGLIGVKVKSRKNQKVKTISRITAYKKDNGTWDVAIFFARTITVRSFNADCFLKEFIEKYQ